MCIESLTLLCFRLAYSENDMYFGAVCHEMVQSPNTQLPKPTLYHNIPACTVDSIGKPHEPLVYNVQPLLSNLINYPNKGE